MYLTANLLQRSWPAFTFIVTYTVLSKVLDFRANVLQTVALSIGLLVRAFNRLETLPEVDEYFEAS